MLKCHLARRTVSVGQFWTYSESTNFVKNKYIARGDLRLRKIAVSVYINDLFTKDKTSEGCFDNVISIE